MLFDQGTPDTSVYMIAGYSIFFIVTVIYLVSLFVRQRNLRRDLETLQSLESEANEPTPEVQAAPSARMPKPTPAKSKTANARPARKKTARKR